jgi:hypothetical protein
MRGVLWDLTDTERLRALASAGSSVSEIDLSTHSAGALYDAFPAPEARRVMKRLQFHHNRKHANWLNMVEMEIGVLPSQCLDRRTSRRCRLVKRLYLTGSLLVMILRNGASRPGRREPWDVSPGHHAARAFRDVQAFRIELPFGTPLGCPRSVHD